MWSSWVKEKGTTQVMYIAKLRDGPKRVKKNFSMILKRVFKMVWWRGENNITSKRVFEVDIFFSSQNIVFHFYLKRLLEPFFHAQSLEDLGVLIIFQKKITSSKTYFQMASIYWWWMHIPEWSFTRQHGQTMIMEMGELWIYWRWTHILEWRYAHQYF
jgi:hypothetical protein